VHKKIGGKYSSRAVMFGTRDVEWGRLHYWGAFMNISLWLKGSRAFINGECSLPIMMRTLILNPTNNASSIYIIWLEDLILGMQKLIASQKPDAVTIIKLTNSSSSPQILPSKQCPIWGSNVWRWLLSWKPNRLCNWCINITITHVTVGSWFYQQTATGEYIRYAVV